ncbi:serine hydrolase [bacterium]|nr:serine hydrolase [bacterium]
MKRTETKVNKSLGIGIVFLFIVFCLGCPSKDSKIQRVENGLLKAVKIKGEPVEPMNLGERMEKYHVPGVSVAVIHNYQMDWAKGYGLRDTEGGEVVNTETLFQAASISKPLTAAAVLSLVENGVLDLEENVNERLVSWKLEENEFTSKRKVTLERLLSHTAGVTVHGFRGYAQGEEVPRLIQVLDGEKPANSDPIEVDILPGTRFRYSGGGYCILQQLLIDVVQKPFPQFMHETVLKPLQMTNSTYNQSLPEKWSTNAAAGYRNNGEKVEGKYHTYPEMAAAGLWTTPSDLSQFVIEIMKSWSGQSHKILSEEMTREMLEERLDGFGLGFMVKGEGEDFSFSHSGGNEGFKCFMTGYPERGDGAVIMTNGDNGSYLYGEMLRSIAAEYGWPDYQPLEKEVVEVNPEVLDDYVGQYRLDQMTLTVRRENGSLMIEDPFGMKAEYLPESKTDFFSPDFNFTVSFVRDEKSVVQEMVMKWFGNKLKAEKMK